jgi:uncharacterized protein (TIGR00369 family)
MHKPSDPSFEQRVRESFAKQGTIALIGASLTLVDVGLVEITVPFHDDLTQQDGYLYGGIVTAIADSASGYAALTLMPEGSEVLAVEFKVNLLRPGVGEQFVARGSVLKTGRTLTVTRADLFAVSEGRSVFDRSDAGNHDHEAGLGDANT